MTFPPRSDRTVIVGPAGLPAGAVLRWPPKPRGATVTYGIDLSGWLAGTGIAGEEVAVLDTAVVAGALRLVGTERDGGLIGVQLAGGVAEHDHALSLSVRATDGRTLATTLRFLVVEQGGVIPAPPPSASDDFTAARRTAELAEDVLRQALSTGLSPAEDLIGSEGLLISQPSEGRRRPRELPLSTLLDATREAGETAVAEKVAPAVQAAQAAADRTDADARAVERARQQVDTAASSLTTGLPSKASRTANLSDLADKQAATAELQWKAARTDAVQRSLAAKLGDVLSVRDFGAVGDGVVDSSGKIVSGTDDGPAFQRAFDAANAKGGGVVYIPPGIYRRADGPGSVWWIYSNTTVIGDGDASVIFFDDRPEIPRIGTSRTGNDLILCSYSDNVQLLNFKILGTAETVLNDTNKKQGICFYHGKNFAMRGVTLQGMRYMATACGFLEDAEFTGNRLLNCVRDGIRATNSSNVLVHGNRLTNVADDCIALHAADEDAHPGNGMVVTGNLIQGSQCIKILGAKNVRVSGNVLRRCIRQGVVIVTPEVGTDTEGGTGVLNIDVTDNLILDTMGNRGTVSVVAISSPARSKGALATQPGLLSAPYAYNYLANIDVDGAVRVGAQGVNVSGNTVARTLPDAARYSDYGYGQLWDRITPGFWSDPTMNATSFGVHFVVLRGPINGLGVTDNDFTALTPGYSALAFRMALQAGSGVDVMNAIVARNRFIDCPGTAIETVDQGSATATTAARRILVQDNVFDLDPYFRSASHNADGTWSSDGVVAFLNRDAPDLIVERNTFSNLARVATYVGATAGLFAADNKVLCDPKGRGTTVGNRGINNLHFFLTPIFCDLDPTSPTYGQTIAVQPPTATAMPTSGRWVEGAYVRNTTLTVVRGRILQGWLRLTFCWATGTHVLGVDWLEDWTTEAAGVAPMRVQRTTTDATPTLLSMDGLTPTPLTALALPDNATVVIDVIITGRQIGGTAGTVGDSASFRVTATARRGVGAGTVEIVGTPIVTALNPTGNTANWAATLAAYTAAGVVTPRVTGEANKQIAWGGRVQFTPALAA